MLKNTKISIDSIFYISAFYSYQTLTDYRILNLMTAAQLIRIAKRTSLADWLGGVTIAALTLAALIMAP